MVSDFNFNWTDRKEALEFFDDNNKTVLNLFNGTNNGNQVMIAPIATKQLIDYVIYEKR